MALTDGSNCLDDARRLSTKARFNIGSFVRNFNVPTTTLFFFEPANLGRFTFTRKRVAADGLWEIAFRETTQPTLIRTPTDDPVPTDGTLWANPEDGTVVRTQMRMHDLSGPGAGTSRGSATIDVVYRRVPALNMWLPDVMTESYNADSPRSWDRINGRAQYSDYRQFQTS